MGEPLAAAERFVGRSRELGELDEACAAAVRGDGRIVVVTGEAGIGKSRLCELLVDRARHAGLRTVLARCWVGGGAPPLWPWQQVVDELCGPETTELLIRGDNGRPDVDPDRFARFAAVTDRLAEVCAETPVCLVVDDVHAADPGALLLIRFLARSRHRLPLLLTLTRRPDEPSADSPEAAHLREIEAAAALLVMQRFDREETGALLALLGLGGLDAEVVTMLHKVTNGNPLFLRRIAALGPPEGADAVPAGLGPAIEGALQQLDPDTRRVLHLGAVLGTTVSVVDAAVVAGTSPVQVLAAVEAAGATGLVALESPDRFRFSHEVIRSALEDGLAAADRLEAHARAALAASGGCPVTAAVVAGEAPAPRSDGDPGCPDVPVDIPVPDVPVDVADIPDVAYVPDVPVERLTRRAHHLLQAAPRSAATARLAVTACQSAARAVMGNFAYERADTLLSAAVALHGPADLGEPSGRLLVDWAQAALACGQMTEARRRFDRAASVAERSADPIVFAHAALGFGGHWVNEHRAPVERSRVLGMQHAALAGLPAGEEALRCRLQVRLAAEAVFDGGPRPPVLDALEGCRRSGDPLALAEGLSLTHHVLLTPEHHDDRLHLADELVRVASEAGHGVLGLMGLMWRAVDLLHLGDPRAMRAVEELRERAQALACQNILYIVDVIDVMLLLGAGRLEEAEAAAVRAFELAEAIGEIDALGYFSAHMMMIRWLQGREAEIADAAEEIAASPTLIQAEFSVRAGAALLAARSGRLDHARAVLDRLAADGLTGLPRSSTWGPGLVAIVEVAAELDDEDIARQAHELLLPYAELPMIASVGVVCLGAAARSLGVAARTFGDLDLAVEHLERAVDTNAQRRNLPALTIAEADLAVTLRRRGAPGDRERAATLLVDAIDRADGMGMHPRTDRWRAELARDTPAVARDSERDDGRDGGSGARRGHVFRDGSRWTLQLDEHRVRLPDLVGVRYLAQLLTRPGQVVPALTLASDGLLPGVSAPHELLDDEARARYAAHIGELTAELAEAESDNDIGRTEKLRLELDHLVDELAAATGLGGRARTFRDPGERARTAVRKAIKRALDTIDDANPTIAAHLRATIATGATCSYTPNPRAPVTWSTHPP